MNQLLNHDQAVSLFDTKLQELCALSVTDAGLDRADALSHVHEATNAAQVQDAVLAFAADMGLDVRGTNWVS